MDRHRGRLGVDQEIVVVADTGQGFTKLSVVRIDRKGPLYRGPRRKREGKQGRRGLRVPV